MIITVASFNGRVGKTTTAIYLATYMQQKAPALLIDGDRLPAHGENAREVYATTRPDCGEKP